MLNDEKYVEDLLANSPNVLEDPDIIADRFLYTRCCVVANGREFFTYVLRNTNAMPHQLMYIFKSTGEIPLGIKFGSGKY